MSGLPDIQVGDKEFDLNFLIKGKREDDIIMFLNPARQKLLLEALKRFPEMEIDDKKILFKTFFVYSDKAEAMVAIIKDLSRLSNSMVG